MAISAMNYAAQAEVGLLELIGRVQGLDINYLKYVSDTIKRAEHFAIPDGGRIINDRLRGIEGMSIKLPYPLITVEYFTPEPKNNRPKFYNPKKIVIAIETTTDAIYKFQQGIVTTDSTENNIFPKFNEFDPDHTADVILCFGAEGGKDAWYMYPVAWALTPSWDDCFDKIPANSRQDNNENNSALKISGHPIIVLPSVFYKLCENSEADKVYRNCIDMVGMVVRDLLEFIEALSCSNVSTKYTQQVSPKINAKRIRTGKLPLYDTKILTITTNKSEYAVAGERAKVSDRQSPRQHLRRGHIRRLDDGRRIWVNSCIVGALENGRIDKQYRIT